MDRLAVILRIAFCLAVLVAETYSNSLWARKYLNRTKRETNCLYDDTFRCTSGTCIYNFYLCDASVDCPDGSDEIAAVCKQHMAPTCRNINMFRCDYGACIDGKKKCNGRKDCPDGSDEKTSTCTTTVISVQNFQSNCRSGRKECKSGGCIDEYDFCDGVANCPDGSDETAEECKDIMCPPYTFRCTYGGCVEESARCNKNKDCIDNSDEAHCNNPAEERTQIILPEQQIRCLLPYLPEFGNYTTSCSLDNPPCILNPGRTYVSDKAWLLFKCNNGYYMNDMSEGNTLYSHCSEGKWTEQLPVCRKMCSPLISSSVEITCWYQEDEVNCNQPMKPGTQATFYCKQMYLQIRPSNRPQMVCKKNGEWNSELIDCQPVCGRTTVINGEFPWYAVLYRNQRRKLEPICSGSLISHHIILTAATCLQKNKIQSEADIKVGFGNYCNEPNDIKEVQQILKHPFYIGKSTKNVYDIALLYLNRTEINSSILPVCIDCNRPLTLAPGMLGMMFKSKESSTNILLNDELRYETHSACVKAMGPAYKGYATFGSFCAILPNSRKMKSSDLGRGLTFLQDGLFYVYGIFSKIVTGTKSYGIFSDVHNSETCKWLKKKKILLN